MKLGNLSKIQRYIKLTLTVILCSLLFCVQNAVADDFDTSEPKKFLGMKGGRLSSHDAWNDLSPEQKQDRLERRKRWESMDPARKRRI